MKAAEIIQEKEYSGIIFAWNVIIASNAHLSDVQCGPRILTPPYPAGKPKAGL